MRQILISALFLSLVSGCSGIKLGPHRIDVQQGNALDQENVSRLKPGLNRSQVRFLLGTPLVVDPFRTDRWDYVYVNYKAGKLAEQKSIALFFDGETLIRIEGDLPAPEPVAAPVAAKVEPKNEAKAEPVVAPSEVEARPLSQPAALKAEPIPAVSAADSKPVTSAAVSPVSQPPQPAPSAKPVQPPVSRPSAPAQAFTPDPEAVPSARRSTGVETSIVQPLPSPKNVPAYRDPRKSAELSLQPETNVEHIRPDAIPVFPEPGRNVVAQTKPVVTSDEPVLSALNAWADAWARRDEDAYLAAYDAAFMPQGNEAQADWEKRRRMLLGVAKNINLKIDSPSVDHLADGSATVTFNQFYRSGSYRDAVVKQLRMVERNGRWLIVEEKVLSVLRSVK